MKSIAEIIEQFGYEVLSGDATQGVANLVLDSRMVEKGSAYFAIKGTSVDGHDFIGKAVEAGASVVFCEAAPTFFEEGVTYIKTKDNAQAVGDTAASFYGNPSQKMKVVGITGTNGKTTIATMLFTLFSRLGYKCGLISTVENIIGSEVIPSTHTTPDAISVQQLMSEMLKSGCSHVFMEVSSHAIHQKRIAGVVFDGGVFSNITHDHLDYHGAFDEYIKAKKAFFDHLPKAAFALSNADEKRGAVMLQNTQASKCMYGIKNHADYKGKVLENQIYGLLMSIEGQEVHFRVTGLFNAFNLMAVYGVACRLGEDKSKVLELLSDIRSAAGRFEVYRSEKERVVGIIDYAHTPDALLNVLATIRQFDSAGRVITIVGCGGDRDKTKRPLMAQVAAKHSDQVIFTSDNPRTEDPESILDDMLDGFSAAYNRKMLRIADRRQAIKTAISLSQPDDIILIAGKGHEKYQDVNGVKQPFDDVEELLNQFKTFDK